MSIEKAITFNGVLVSGCKIVVGALTINEAHDLITFSVMYYAEGSLTPFNREYMECEFKEGDDPIEAAYAYLNG